MLYLHPIKNQASPYWDSLVRVYLQSFPLDEQRPIASIAHLLTEEPRYTMHAIIDDNYAAELQAVGHWPLAVGSSEDDNGVAELQANSQKLIAKRHQPTANSQRPKANSPKALGLLTTWHFEEFIYIEHFAIDPSLRSQGYGSEALKAFIKEQCKPIILEAEPPTDELSIRRIHFYERSGFVLHDYPYMQPAYTEDSHSVELRLMSCQLSSSLPLEHISHTLHREVYGKRNVI